MADEENPNKEEEKEAEDKASNEEGDGENEAVDTIAGYPKKLVIILGAAVAGILLLLITLMIILMMGGEPEKDIEEKQSANAEQAKNAEKSDEERQVAGGGDELIDDSEAEVRNFGRAYFYSIRPAFVVNILAGGRRKFLQIQVDVMSRDSETIDFIRDYLPLIKNELVILFASKSFDEIKTPEGKERLRKEALNILREIQRREKGSSQVENVLFTSFVMQ